MAGHRDRVRYAREGQQRDKCDEPEPASRSGTDQHCWTRGSTAAVCTACADHAGLRAPGKLDKGDLETCDHSHASAFIPTPCLLTDHCHRGTTGREGKLSPRAKPARALGTISPIMKKAIRESARATHTVESHKTCACASFKTHSMLSMQALCSTERSLSCKNWACKTSTHRATPAQKSEATIHEHD